MDFTCFCFVDLFVFYLLRITYKKVMWVSVKHIYEIKGCVCIISQKNYHLFFGGIYHGKGEFEPLIY